MEKENVIIIIATFYAFGIKHQKAFINKNEEEITAELTSLCMTEHLISLEYFSATHTQTKQFNEESVITSLSKGREED